MTDITFGPATNKPKKIIAGLAGGTGSGKTYSALEIGSGLVSDPAIQLFVIDTEAGRAAHYAEEFAFQYGELRPPFTPERYMAAIDAAVSSGARCVIVDSLSHMWEGEGGALDQAADIAKKMAARSGGFPEQYSFPSWNEPTGAITKFVLYLQKRVVHLVLCFRAKEKSEMIKRVAPDGRSKTEIVAMGLQPIMKDGLPYECDFVAMLAQEAPGVPHWTHKALSSYLQRIFDNRDRQLSRGHGRLLAQWCGDTGDAQTVAKELPSEQTARLKKQEDDAGLPQYLRSTTSTRLSKRRAEEIMEALRVCEDLHEIEHVWYQLLPEIETASPEGQRAIENVYTYRLNTLTAEQSSKAAPKQPEQPGQAAATESAQDSGDTSAPAGGLSTGAARDWAVSVDVGGIGSLLARAEQAPPKRRGRPPGSKNKPKEPPLSDEDWAAASDAAIAAGQPAEDSNEDVGSARRAEAETRAQALADAANPAGQPEEDSDDITKLSGDDGGPTGPLYKIQDPGTGVDLGPFPPDEFVQMVRVLAEEPMTQEELLRLRATTAEPLKEIAYSIPDLRDAAAVVRDFMTQRIG